MRLVEIAVLADEHETLRPEVLLGRVVFESGSDGITLTDVDSLSPSCFRWPADNVHAGPTELVAATGIGETGTGKYHAQPTPDGLLNDPKGRRRTIRQKDPDGRGSEFG